MENGDYLYIQTSETSYDYTLYGPDYKELDGGQLDNPDLSLAEAGKEIPAAGVERDQRPFEFRTPF